MALAAGHGIVVNRERHLRAAVVDEIGVRLIVAPAVGVTVPLAAVEMEELGFQLSRSLWRTCLHWHGERANEDAVSWEAKRQAFEDIIRLPADGFVVRYGDPALRGCAVGPLRDLHGVRDDTGGGLLARRVC